MMLCLENQMVSLYSAIRRSRLANSLTNKGDLYATALAHCQTHFFLVLAGAMPKKIRTFSQILV